MMGAAGSRAVPQALVSPVQGVVSQLAAAVGQRVAAGQVVVVLESMKMEVPVAAPCSGTVTALLVGAGEAVDAAAELARVQPDPEPEAAGATAAAEAAPAAAAAPRAELQALRARRTLLEDAARPEAMARRHAQGLRSARENVADLLDPGSFSEY
ncbi:MAG: biotin/lipoyl-containing protein, partial [Rubrivivax sp.]